MSPKSFEARSFTPRELIRRYFIVLAALLLTTCGFALLHPMTGSPDENAHQRYAYAVVTGQIPVAADQMVTVPDVLTAEGPGCWRFNPQVPSTCAIEQDPMSARGAQPVRTLTQAANYPPLYYALVGLPLRTLEHPGASGHRAIYMSRMLSCLVFSLLAAAGLCALAGKGPITPRWVMACWLILPSAAVISAAINPQSLEIGAALLFAGAAWPLLRGSQHVGTRFWTMGVASALLIQSRPAGVLWAVILSAMLAIALWGRLRVILRLPAFWGFIGLSAISSLIWLAQQTIWTHTDSYEQTQKLPHCDIGCVAADLWSKAWPFSRQTIGVTGWLDADIQTAPALAGLLVIACVLLAGLVAGPWPRRIALALGIVAVPGSALLIVAATVDVTGAMWQARYALPLLIPLLWLALQRARPVGRDEALKPGRWFVLEAAAATVATLAMGSAFLSFGILAARRFWVGLGGDFPLLPALPRAAALGLSVYQATVALALITSGLVLLRMVRRYRARTIDTTTETHIIKRG